MKCSSAKGWLRRLVFSWLVLLPGLVLAQPGSPDGLTYKTGYSAIRRLGLDLFKSMKPKYKPFVHIEPVSVETDVMPFIKLEEYPDEPKPLRMVFISVGFVDLVNNVAHAKAIDKKQKGYFQKYVLSLALETGEKELKELPNLSDKQFWTEDMMNEQLSNFNQIVGVAVGVKLAQFYLGQYQKYDESLKDQNGKPVPINNLLTPQEWELCNKAGVRNALDAGYGIEGVKALYDCIDKMPKRPVWTSYFLPDNIKVSKLLRDMEKIQRDFFAGKSD